MKERPIFFRGEMVRAILGGSKTQTRRIVKFKYFSHDQMKFCHAHPKGGYQFSGTDTYQEVGSNGMQCPYGKVGDRLWVRETWRLSDDMNHLKPSEIRVPTEKDNWSWAIDYLADQKPSQWGIGAGKIRPSIFMPRWASRITLEITNIRVERLNDISASDTLAEGVDNGISNPTMGKRWENMQHIAFVDLWEKINGEGSWAENPWVWVIEFKRINR